jgi:hypothetical protein
MNSDKWVDGTKERILDSASDYYWRDFSTKNRADSQIEESTIYLW